MASDMDESRQHPRQRSPQQSRQNTVDSAFSILSSSPDSTMIGRRRGSILLPTQVPGTPRRMDSIHFQELERKLTEVKETRTVSVTRTRARRHSSVLSEASNWHGQDRVKLVKEGYQTLALLSTFIAGVQAQLLQITYNQTDSASQVVNALFFAGLFADIGASILSAASARWYEMLTPEEADHVYDWLFETLRKSQSPERSEVEMEGDEREEEEEEEEEPKASTNEKGKGVTASASAVHLEAQIKTRVDRSYFSIERWLCLGLKSGAFVALLGLGFLAAGVMVYVWAYTSMIVQILSTASCVFLLLLPPFFLPHDRIRTLTYVKLQRYSGR